MLNTQQQREAEYILRYLADSNPIVFLYETGRNPNYHVCRYCRGSGPENDQVRHRDTCVWRRASDLLGERT